jgi:hypothetical protein
MAVTSLLDMLPRSWLALSRFFAEDPSLAFKHRNELGFF